MIAGSANRYITIGRPMKTILCYGDSNTWGAVPGSDERYALSERWHGVLAQELGADYRVIEEGLNGRTTVWNDPIEGYKNGKEFLIPCLESHRPLDLVVIMLGTNDLKMRFSVSAYDIAQSVGVLVDIVQKSAAGPNHRAPQVLLLAPPVIGRLTEYADMFGESARDRSRQFAKYYRGIAERDRCHFLDTAQVIVSSDLDGIHLAADQHRKLGRAVAARVREIFG
jgi:lysophospholipase L1-like esterase